MRVKCPTVLIESTLNTLREAGRRELECVVLWLGEAVEGQLMVRADYKPLQTARFDRFHIPPAGMADLHAQLRRHRNMVAAQVHSHPSRAFHSEADDQWAIIRHQGALSLVVPDFALRTDVPSFLTDTKVYQFSSDALWTEVPAEELEPLWLQIT